MDLKHGSGFELWSFVRTADSRQVMKMKSWGCCQATRRLVVYSSLHHGKLVNQCGVNNDGNAGGHNVFCFLMHEMGILRLENQLGFALLIPLGRLVSDICFL